MEEVDNIIIHSLRQIGCDVEDNITNLSGFQTELVIDATVRCLNIIRPGLGLSTVLPENMTARFRLGAALAQACLDLGYKGDIGYQTFLYSSEVDLRRVFMFLIEKLPKECDKSLNEPTSRIALLEKSIASTVAKDLSSSWLPPYCHKQGPHCRGRTTTAYNSIELDLPIAGKDEDFQNYYIHYQRPINEQASNQRLLPSVISHNARLIYGKPTDILEKLDWLNEQKEEFGEAVHENQEILSRFTLNERLQFAKDNITEEKSPFTESPVKTPVGVSLTKEEKQELAVENAKMECETLRNTTEELQTEIRKLNVKLAQLTTTRQAEEKELAVRQEQRRIKARTYDLLPDGEENIKKLEAAIEAGANKLIHLANQWERHRGPLIEKYRDERAKYSSKASASQKKVDELKILRDREQELLEELRNKDQQYAQLMADVQKLPKEINRSAYTQRILEIINNVRKQRDEIDKVLADTRKIQKEINTLTGRLERSFTVVDELIFRDARSNEASRKAYKLLATLHSDCSELVDLVEETGATIREIRDLEEQIDSESTKNVGANLERITADLKQMKQETAILTAQLQNKNS
ncbi:coiled-coil domain-containing protein 22 homolog [Cephus cinctus]|uniref:Coiled-coil domain-containing protein 22 homolog n=1 Tax=Cephus cinctus TaxID=211228 RepID=A0AAJ7BXK7_CEPCN|nr:coiled-coil domain-containing protein 22 homolog [Cephus cinctus]